MKMDIIAIVAANGAIGLNGDQPFHISADFRRFKQLTLGHPVIMGRKTFEALPKGALPGRQNIVITSNPHWSAKDVTVASSLNRALELCNSTEATPFIIGGGQIYRMAMPLASTLHITQVNAEVPEADTFFPEISANEWILTDKSPWQSEPGAPPFRFLTYRRK